MSQQPEKKKSNMVPGQAENMKKGKDLIGIGILCKKYKIKLNEAPFTVGKVAMTETEFKKGMDALEAERKEAKKNEMKMPGKTPEQIKKQKAEIAAKEQKEKEKEEKEAAEQKARKDAEAKRNSGGGK